ncbi:MAG: PHP domain-containing protein [Acholeplasmataceae bacterium]|nr:PHP domain-containing protein [Acholeplasmataceae bacterium]
MSIKILGDFHIHTTYSDGLFSVEEVLAMAKNRNLSIIAITDHDVLAGSLKAKSLESAELKAIVGIELSTEYRGESIHILGYFPDPKNLEGLEEFLNEQREGRKKRAFLIKELLLKHFNIDLNMDFTKSMPSITRGAIAQAIINQGFPYTHDEIFTKIIGRGCPAYLPSTKLDTESGIRLLKEYGAFTVLAHPVLLKKNAPEDIVQMGVDGIEAIYPVNTNEDTEKFIHLAQKEGLFVTAGSDFHGFDDAKHGNLGEHYLEGRNLEIFLNKITKGNK